MRPTAIGFPLACAALLWAGVWPGLVTDIMTTLFVPLARGPPELF